MPTTSALPAELDALPARWEVHGTLGAPVTAVAALLLAVAEGRVGETTTFWCWPEPRRHGRER
ncbi:hypothetical protein STENM36S_08110 [Streptomyces tendae]